MLIVFERALALKQYSMAAFLDIEGVFNKVSMLADWMLKIQLGGNHTVYKNIGSAVIHNKHNIHNKH